MKSSKIAFWCLVCIAAIACGLGWTAWTVKRPDDVAISAGPWKANLLAGAATADAQTRARVAVGGLLALGRDETLYYVARTDSAGRALQSRCEYRISGLPPDSRWWSITAYADDNFLFPDAQQHFSVNGSSIKTDSEGVFVAYSGPRQQTADGKTTDMRTPGDRGLIFTLRLYQPASALQQDPSMLKAPGIERTGDC